ncbi:hypothetical protein EDC01DRAFT_678529, partial [Geopyxis carbonaria]
MRTLTRARALLLWSCGVCSRTRGGDVRGVLGGRRTRERVSSGGQLVTRAAARCRLMASTDTDMPVLLLGLEDRGGV